MAPDALLFAGTIALLLFGLVMLYSASAIVGRRERPQPLLLLRAAGGLRRCRVRDDDGRGPLRLPPPEPAGRRLGGLRGGDLPADRGAALLPDRQYQPLDPHLRLRLPALGAGEAGAGGDPGPPAGGAPARHPSRPGAAAGLDRAARLPDLHAARPRHRDLPGDGRAGGDLRGGSAPRHLGALAGVGVPLFAAAVLTADTGSPASSPSSTPSRTRSARGSS